MTGDRPLDRAHLDAAIRGAGYQPGAAPWLSPDLSVWRTVLGAAVAVAAVAVAVSVLGPADLASGLSDPARGGLLLVLVLGSLPAVLLLAVALLLLTTRIRSSFSPDGIELRYAPFVTVRLMREEVTRIERVDAGLLTYGGFGLRRLSGGGYAMLFDAGPVLRITAADGKGYVVRSDAPEQAVAAIGLPAA